MASTPIDSILDIVRRICRDRAAETRSATAMQASFTFDGRETSNCAKAAMQFGKLIHGTRHRRNTLT